jgi:hypothetical protein
VIIGIELLICALFVLLLVAMCVKPGSEEEQ